MSMVMPATVDGTKTAEVSPAAAVANTLNDGKKHLLLAASGSVATIKLPLIAAAFSKVPNLSIRIILTPNAARFLQGQSAEQPPVASLLDLPNVDSVHVGDTDEWNPSWVRNAPILHIELRRWAHLLVVAPLSANLLAKIANGLCDSLLSSVIRAWDTDPAAGKRILVAPAMNVMMFTHPITARQLNVLRSWAVEEGGTNASTGAGAGAVVVGAASGSDGTEVQQQQQTGTDGGKSVGWFEILLPTSKALACGDVGLGAMVDWRDIVLVIRERLSLSAEHFPAEESR